MEVIEVKADPGPDGLPYPRSIVFHGEEFHIDSIGRRWRDEDGQHVLVMIQPNDRVFELLYTRGVWHLVRGFRSTLKA